MRTITTIPALFFSPADAAPAAAPRPKATNRYDVLFVGTVIKHSTDATQTYGEEGKRKSKKLADVVMTLRDGCGIITGKIQAVQNPGQKKPVAQFSFTASMRGGQALQADSDKAQKDLDLFASSIVTRYMAERKERRAAGDNDAPAPNEIDDLSL